jgi:flagellar hook-associated protein 3 FlgL
MTIGSGISFLGQTTTQIDRLNDLRTTLSDLQRQVTTQKKYETMAALGSASLNVQRLRGDTNQIKGYIDNIDAVSTRMDVMTSSMAQAADLGRELISGIQIQVRNGQVDMDTISQIAQQSLKMMQDLANQTLEGRYLFAGSDSLSPPFVDDSTLTSNFQAQISSWLAGTQTDVQLNNNTDAFTAVNLGFANGLATAGNVTARIDTNLDIDYTVKADGDGFKDIMRALAFAANLTYPTGADVATPDQFNNVLDHILSLAGQGVQEMDAATAQLSSKYTLVKDLQQNHKADFNLYSSQIDKAENVDTTQVVAELQALQTQLTASYQVTHIVSQLSLVNFM